MAEQSGDYGHDPAFVASYLAALTADLAVMARQNGHGTLGYLLEMARLEAESILRQNGRRKGG